MYTSLSNRLLATVMVCSLLLQGCGSGLRAITEEAVLKQDPPTTADPVQASGEALLPGVLALVPSREDARVSGASGRMSPTELAVAVVPAYRRVFMGPFTASSGERVLLGQQQGQWQALLQGGAGAVVHRRALPVVGSGDIGASLQALQGQDAWSSRSRIHVLSAPHMPSTPCVYVGKLGLLGGAPTSQAQLPALEWLSGPTMILGSNATSRAVYHIPPGYRYKDYRLKAGSVVQRASLTINYVAANNEEEYRRLEFTQNAQTAGVKFGANTDQVVTSDTLEGDVDHSDLVEREGHDLQRTKHAGLLLYGSTKENEESRPESKIDIQVEILLEKVGEALPAHPRSFSDSWGADRGEDVAPFAQGSSLFQADSPISGECERRYKSKLSSLKGEYEALLSKQQEAQKQFESLEDETARLVAQRVEAQALLSQTATPTTDLGASEGWKKLQAAQAQRQCEYETKLASAVQVAEERASLVEEELAKLKRAYAEQLALVEQEQASFRAAYEELLSQQKEAQERSISALREEIAHLAVQQAEKQALLSRLLPQPVVPAMAFGAQAWEQYFGKVDTEPTLPTNIGDILNSKCPFCPGKQVKDTHLLVLIPAKVNGKPFSLDLLGELIQHPRGGGYAADYNSYGDLLKEAYGTQSPERPYWVLMTRDVLEGSRSKTYASQKDLVAGHAKRTGLSYELPGALEAATAILSHYVRSGERLYTDAPRTYTRCREFQKGNFFWTDSSGNKHPFDVWYAVVVGFSSGGLSVDFNDFDDYNVGVAGLRKF